MNQAVSVTSVLMPQEDNTREKVVMELASQIQMESEDERGHGKGQHLNSSEDFEFMKTGFWASSGPYNFSASS